LLKEYEEINLKFSEPMSDDEMNQLIEKQGELMKSWITPMPGNWTTA
jgi:sulfate-transporting ATPase